MPKSRHKPAGDQQPKGARPHTHTVNAPPVRTSYYVLAGVAILGLLHLALSFAPGIATWGLDYWSAFPLTGRLALLAILFLSLIPPVGRVVDRAVARLPGGRATSLVALSILGVILVIFQSKGLAYGDGYAFLGYFANGRFPELTSQLTTQALDLIVHWAVYKFICLPLGQPVTCSYAFWGALGGIAGMAAIWRIARMLSNDRPGRYLIVASALASGGAVLWFGYVESYTLANTALLWALVFALEAQETRARIWPGWLAWLLAVAFHQLAVAVFPMLVWAHWRSVQHERPAPGRSTLAAFLGAGFLAWAAATFVYRMAGPPIFVNIVPTTDSIYAAFSSYHLLDMVNLIFFLAPAGVIGLILWLWKPGGASPARLPLIGIVAVCAASAWYFSFWVDPLIGAFRDWDLLGLFGVPLSIWAATVIIRHHPRQRVPGWLWVGVAGLAVVHTGGFVATLQSEEGAALRIDRLVREDVHYGGGFFNGTRLAPWSAIIGKRLQRYDLAKDHLAYRVQLDPDDGLAWANLGNACQKLGQIDSAAVNYREALARQPDNVRFANNLGILLSELNDFEGTRTVLEQCVSLSDTAYGARTILSRAYLELGMPGDAVRMAGDAIRLRPEGFGPYYFRGLAYATQGDTARAIEDLEQALAHGGVDEDVYSQLVQLYQWSGDIGRAISTTERWERSFPNTPQAPFLAGTTYIMNEQFAEANVQFARAFARDPDNALTAYYLAMTHRVLGHLEEAREMALRSADLNPRLGLPWLELVYLAADTGDEAGAVSATREYLRRMPSDSGMSYLQQFIRR